MQRHRTRKTVVPIVTTTIIAVAVALAAPLTSPGVQQPAAAKTPTATDRLARLPDGRTLRFRCAGSGSPTVLFDSGWGGDSRGWGRVIGPVASRTRACAYDRAGYGASTPGPMPRDGGAIARDLDRGLRAAGIAGPFVVVGHSAGGLYMRAFAERRPGDVVGMVLVDATIPFQQRRFEEAFGRGAGSLDPLIRRAGTCLAAARAGSISEDDPAIARCAVKPPLSPVGHWATRLSELDTLFGATSSRIEQGRSDYGAMPLIVLTAGRTYPGVGARYWANLQSEVAARSTRGEMRFIPDSGHLMMNDRPDAVIQAVNEVIEMAKEPAGSPAPAPASGESDGLLAPAAEGTTD